MSDLDNAALQVPFSSQAVVSRIVPGPLHHDGKACVFCKALIVTAKEMLNVV
jgi:hypothetical protein